MSQKKKNSTKNRSSHEKRTAKASPKSSEEKRARVAAEREKRDVKKKREMTSSRGRKILAVFFSALLIIAFATPSVAALGSCSAKDEQVVDTNGDGVGDIVESVEGEESEDAASTDGSATAAEADA